MKVTRRESMGQFKAAQPRWRVWGDTRCLAENPGVLGVCYPINNTVTRLINSNLAGSWFITSLTHDNPNDHPGPCAPKLRVTGEPWTGDRLLLISSGHGASIKQARDKFHENSSHQRRVRTHASNRVRYETRYRLSPGISACTCTLRPVYRCMYVTLYT